MKVLAHVHQAPPDHSAGSEVMMLTILRMLAERGHECRMITDRGRACELHGVRIEFAGRGAPDRIGIKRRAHRWADVVLTHLMSTYDATKHAKSAGIPIVHLVHNDWTLTGYRVTPKSCQLAVFNSEWLTNRVGWDGPQTIVRPPVVPQDYTTTPGDSVTLVNLSERKGAGVFYELAERHPDVPFIGVLGGHSAQIVRDDLPNVTILDHTDDMRAVYGKTRVVLMPSEYESWGRVAIEAACSGIPTIAHPTPGLTESLGAAGVFADRANLDEWDAALQRVLDATEQERVCEALTLRAHELAAVAVEDMTRLDEKLEALA